MKNTILVILALLMLSCSSNDDSPSFDVNLLFGQWFKDSRCDTQNHLTLNTDYTYVLLESPNRTCDDNEHDTYKFTGTFTLNGDYITFNELTSEIVIEGTHIGSLDTYTINLLYSKIIRVDEESLIIERKFDDPFHPFRNWSFHKN